MTNEVLRVWALDPNDAEATTAALDGTAEPEFRAAVIRSSGDTLVLQVVAGEPRGAEGGPLHVERRGTFRVARREEWEPFREGGPRRVLLVLVASPRG